MPEGAIYWYGNCVEQWTCVRKGSDATASTDGKITYNTNSFTISHTQSGLVRTSAYVETPLTSNTKIRIFNTGADTYMSSSNNIDTKAHPYSVLGSNVRLNNGSETIVSTSTIGTGKFLVICLANQPSATIKYVIAYEE